MLEKSQPVFPPSVHLTKRGLRVVANQLSALQSLDVRRLGLILIALAAGAILGRIFAVDSVDVYQLERQRWLEIPRRLEARRLELQERGVDPKRIEADLARMRQALEAEAALRRPFLSANDRSRWCTVRALVEPDMRVPGAPYAIDKVIQERRWDTIDMVKHSGHLYSSKPPLFATLVAAEYWVLYNLFGLTLRDHPYQVAWVVLITFNLLPLLVYFWAVLRLVERLTTCVWCQLFTLAFACFGTFITTFANTLNNHLPGAVCAAVGLELAVRIILDGQRHWWLYLLLGVISALGVTFELPSLIFWLLLAVLVTAYAFRPALLWFFAGSVLVAAAFFGTNWIAHGTLAPPYAHRSGGEGQNWYDYDYEVRGRKVESYWRNPVGVDRGEASVAVYAFHVLVGHHGIFSLTPLWLLSVVGLIWGVMAARKNQHILLYLGILAISVICILFYIFRPEADRSYGGMSSCFRWVLWLTPLWLLGMLPVLERLSQSRLGRGVVLVLAAFSAMSAAYPTWNPWTHPWLFLWLESAGLISY